MSLQEDLQTNGGIEPKPLSGVASYRAYEKTRAAKKRKERVHRLNGKAKATSGGNGKQGNGVGHSYQSGAYIFESGVIVGNKGMKTLAEAPFGPTYRVENRASGELAVVRERGDKQEATSYTSEVDVLGEEEVLKDPAVQTQLDYGGSYLFQDGDPIYLDDSVVPSGELVEGVDVDIAYLTDFREPLLLPDERQLRVEQMTDYATTRMDQDH